MTTTASFEICLLRDDGTETWITIEGPDAITQTGRIRDTLHAYGLAPIIYRIDSERARCVPGADPIPAPPRVTR